MQLINDILELKIYCLKDVYEELLFHDELKLLLKWGKISFSLVKSGENVEVAEKILSLCIQNLLSNEELDLYSKSVVLEFINPIAEFYNSKTKGVKKITDLFTDEHYKKVMS